MDFKTLNEELQQLQGEEVEYIKLEDLDKDFLKKVIPYNTEMELQFEGTIRDDVATSIDYVTGDLNSYVSEETSEGYISIEDADWKIHNPGDEITKWTVAIEWHTDNFEVSEKLTTENYDEIYDFILEQSTSFNDFTITQKY